MARTGRGVEGTQAGVKGRFNMALDRLDLPPRPPASAGLTGTWTTVDPEGRGIEQLVLADAGGLLTVQAYGACQPAPCDWGVVRGRAYAAAVDARPAVAFSAAYTFEFKTVLVTGRLEGPLLALDCYNAFSPGDARSDYHWAGLYRRLS